MLRGFELKRSRRQIELVLKAVQAPTPPDGLRDKLLAQVPMSGTRRTPRLALGMAAVGLVLVALAAALWPKQTSIAKNPEPTKVVVHQEEPTHPITTVPTTSEKVTEKLTPRPKRKRPPEREEVAMHVTVGRAAPNESSYGKIVALSTDAEGREVKTEWTFTQDHTGLRKEENCVTDASGEQHKISTTKSNRVAEADGEEQ
jgi:hypothetical protein